MKNNYLMLAIFAQRTEIGLMRSEKEKETRPPMQREDGYCCSASEQQWWKIQHDGAN